MPTPRRVEISPSDIKWDIDGMSLPDVVSFLQRKQTELTKQGLTDLKIDIGEESDYGDREYAYVRIKGFRMETNEEAALREGSEKARDRAVELREREQLKRLTEKYGS